MKKPKLKAEERTVLGKKVKQLRREGYLPANVYGKGLNSHALQVKVADFEAVYKEAGETGLVDLTYNEKTKPVLIKNLQKNFTSNTLLHADFYQVNLKEKVKTTVPIVLTGEAKAVAEKVGLLLQNLSDVEIEALPDSLPEHIEVNVEHLAEVGDSVTVGDLKAPEGVEILTDPSYTVAKVGEATVEEEVPEEGAEGAEGEAAAEEKPEGDAKEESGESASEGAAAENESAEKKEE